METRAGKFAEKMAAVRSEEKFFHYMRRFIRGRYSGKTIRQLTATEKRKYQAHLKTMAEAHSIDQKDPKIKKKLRDTFAIAKRKQERKIKKTIKKELKALEAVSAMEAPSTNFESQFSQEELKESEAKVLSQKRVEAVGTLAGFDVYTEEDLFVGSDLIN